MIQPLLLTLAVFCGGMATYRRNWSGNYAWCAIVAGLLAAFGHAVGAYS